MRKPLWWQAVNQAGHEQDSCSQAQKPSRLSQHLHVMAQSIAKWAQSMMQAHLRMLLNTQGFASEQQDHAVYVTVHKAVSATRQKLVLHRIWGPLHVGIQGSPAMIASECGGSIVTLNMTSVMLLTKKQPQAAMTEVVVHWPRRLNHPAMYGTLTHFAMPKALRLQNAPVQGFGRKYRQYSFRAC